MKRSQSVSRVLRMKTTPHPGVLALLCGLLVLVFATPIAVGQSADATATETDVAGVDVTRPDKGSDVEQVTISIDLEEGGEIDLEASTGEVLIDSWDGDQVLVIIEKISVPRPGLGRKPAEPINIQVTRRGKDVRIAALGNPHQPQSGFDVSYRIMMPRKFAANVRTEKHKYDFSKVTTVIFRALHKEALRWIGW